MSTLHIDFFGLTGYAWIVLGLFWLYFGMRTKITIKKQSSASRLIYLVFMAAAFVLVYGSYTEFGFFALRILPKKDWISFLGLAINLAGIAFAIIARSWLGSNWSGAVTIKKDHELIRNGPYSVTRHPIYTGLLFGLLGAAIVLGEARGLIGLIVLFIAIQMKTKTEETFLRKEFNQYDGYAHRIKKLIPFIY